MQFAVQRPIEIEGDEAIARCICHEAARGLAGSFYRNHGVFRDRLHRSDDRWVFVSRSYEYIWLDTSPFAGDGFKLSGVVAHREADRKPGDGRLTPAMRRPA